MTTSPTAVPPAPGRSDVLTASALAEEIDDRSPRGIAAAVARMVHDGRLVPGDRLPTVRDLAVALSVSPATVGNAWQALASVGIAAARGRAGTSVLPPPGGWLPPRYRRLVPDEVPEHEGTRRARPRAPRLDLSTGTPDPELLPDVRPALAREARRPLSRSTVRYADDPVLPGLESLLRSEWPFVPRRITVVDGAMDAIGRVLQQVTGYGDRVAVEDPGFPPVFDLLDQMRLERVPLALDRWGVLPSSLRRAVDAGARVVVVQPRAHNPTGATMSPTRVRELARVLRPHPHVLVVEDDHAGEIASSRAVSLGPHLPDRVVHVRSFSKSHDPDLRVAALGGPATVVDGLVARRMLGPAWTSRLVQRVLLDLLTDGDAIDAVAHARRVYHARRRGLLDVLAVRGIALPPGDGFNLWLPVRDETAALTRLSASGVRAAPGSPFRAAGTSGRAHLRVTVSALREEPEPVAELLVRAARA